MNLKEIHVTQSHLKMAVNKIVQYENKYTHRVEALSSKDPGFKSWLCRLPAEALQGPSDP